MRSTLLIPTDPARERLKAIAAIFAKAILRLRARSTVLPSNADHLEGRSSIGAESCENPKNLTETQPNRLDVASETRLSVPTS